MAFSRTSTNITLNSNHILQATCTLINSGTTQQSTIDLNTCIGNSNGKFKWGFDNFSSSLDPKSTPKVTTENNVTTLYASLLDSRNQSTPSQIILDEQIANMNGVLQFQHRVAQTIFVGDGCYDGFMKVAQTQKPLQKLDVLLVAFCGVDSSGKPTFNYNSHPIWESRVQEVIKLAKNQNSNAPILVQFDYNQLTHFESTSGIDAFVQALPAFLNTYGFQGIDIDWESTDSGFLPSQELATYLFSQLRKYVGTGYVSISANTTASLDANQVNQYIDFVNVQSYGAPSLVDGFLKIFSSFKIQAGILSEGGDSISAYTQYFVDHKLGGLYAWRIDNDTTVGDVPTFVVTNLMWNFKLQGPY